ncbi:immunoglobulin superfamily member 5-like [Synchiropus picturatus]
MFNRTFLGDKVENQPRARSGSIVDEWGKWGPLTNQWAELTRFIMNIFPVVLFLLSSKIEGVAAQMKLSPETLTVLRGEEARFTCTSSSPNWSAMVWLLNGTVALTISKIHGVISSDDHDPSVTAEKNPASRGDSWVFVLKNTERSHQGSVTCDLQGLSRKTATLFVQEKGSIDVFGSQMAFKGQEVQFECRAAGWHPQPSLTWQVNDRKVSQSDYNISSEETGKSLFTVTSNLTVTAVKSSHVDCLVFVSALPTPLSSGVRLLVVAEVVQDPTDCTVPLAITATLAALSLLLLLCTCTVLCYRQRRQTKAAQPREIRFIQPLGAGGSVAEVTTGTVNLGFAGESSTDTVYDDLVKAIQRQKDFINNDKACLTLCENSNSLLSLQSTGHQRFRHKASLASISCQSWKTPAPLS